MSDMTHDQSRDQYHDQYRAQGTGDTETRDTETKDAKDTEAKKAFDAGKSAAANRWLLMLVGCVTLVAGAVALAMPFVASLTAALLVGWLLIATGAVGLVTAFRRKEGWALAASFAFSLLSIVAGVLMLAQPLTGIFALTTVLIAYFFAAGAVRVYFGAKAWKSGGAWMVATGVLSVLLAVLLTLGLPFSAAWVPGVMLAVDLIMWGAVQIALAVRIGREVSDDADLPGSVHS